jgi:hypothetical protein
MSYSIINYIWLGGKNNRGHAEERSELSTSLTIPAKRAILRSGLRPSSG